MSLVVITSVVKRLEKVIFVFIQIEINNVHYRK